MGLVITSGSIREIGAETSSECAAQVASSPLLADLMPNMVLNLGRWEGIHHHFDLDGNFLDEHKSEAECIFPARGSFYYIHKEVITRKDGQKEQDTANAVYQAGRLWIQNDKFEGSAWEACSGVTLFNLIRKDNPRCSLKEMIAVEKGSASRARALQWFEDGKLVKRSLCNENRVY